MRETLKKVFKRFLPLLCGAVTLFAVGTASGETLTTIGTPADTGSSSGDNPVITLYSEMSQPVNSVKPKVSDPYLQKLTDYLTGGKLRDFNEPHNDYERLIRTLHLTRNAPGLAGLFADWYKGKTYDDYVRERDRIIEDFLINADPFSPSFSLDSAWGEILSGIYAGYSFGWIPQPDATKQLINEGDKLLYSFRVGQQKVREATLLTEAKRILALTKQLNDLYRQFSQVCPTEDVSEEIKFPPNDTPDVPRVYCYCTSAGCCSCSCTCNYEGEFHYVPITSSLESFAKIFVSESVKTRRIACADYLARIMQLKTELETTKMNLYNLSASYGLLENDEKVKSGI